MDICYPQLLCIEMKIQSTTSITDFFVVGKMSVILVKFGILVGHDLFTL